VTDRAQHDVAATLVSHPILKHEQTQAHGRTRVADTSDSQHGNTRQEAHPVTGTFEATVTLIQAAISNTAARISVETNANWNPVFAFVGFAAVIGMLWMMEYLITWSERGAGSNVEELQEKHEKGNITRCFPAIGFVQFLTSWHIVLYNFYDVGNQLPANLTWANFARWGCANFPLWFVMSGFLNTYSKLCGPKKTREEDVFTVTAMKIAAWYPLYLLCLVWCSVWTFSLDAEDWSHFLGNALLFNGIIWNEPQFPYFLGDWWLCWLTIYLVVSVPMFHIIYSGPDTIFKTIIFMSFVLCVPCSIWTWYIGNQAIFMMLQFWFAFLFGQATAFWMVRNCMRSEPVILGEQGSGISYSIKPAYEVPLLVRFGVTISFMILAICMICLTLHMHLPVCGKPIEPLLMRGGLLPSFGLLVMGLACGIDPLAKLFARKPFRWGNKLALMTFLLQTPIHQMVVNKTGLQGLSWTFCSLLLVGSILGHFFLEAPWRQALHMRAK